MSASSSTSFSPSSSTSTAQPPSTPSASFHPHSHLYIGLMSMEVDASDLSSHVAALEVRPSFPLPPASSFISFRCKMAHSPLTCLSFLRATRLTLLSPRSSTPTLPQPTSASISFVKLSDSQTTTLPSPFAFLPLPSALLSLLDRSLILAPIRRTRFSEETRFASLPNSRRVESRARLLLSFLF